MRKINGLTQTPHPYQISSYIIFFLLVTAYLLITFPLSTTPAKIVGVLLEATSCLILVISGYIVTTTDPSDSLLLATLKARAEGNFEAQRTSEFMCSFDKSYVDESSKHCKRCGRCTEGFDHHCKWVNNDIGKKNYKSFIVLISSVWFFLLFYLVFGALVTAEYIKDSDFLEHEIFMYTNGSEHILTGLIILWVTMGLSIFLFVMTTNLVLFHMFLIRKGLTTFEYLTLVGGRKDNKKQMETAARAMGDKKSTCLDFVIFFGKNRKRTTKQDNTTKNKQKTNKNQIPNQNQANCDPKQNKDGFGKDNIDLENQNSPLTPTGLTCGERLRTEEQVLLSSPTRKERFTVKKPMGKAASDKLMRPIGGESPTNLIPLEDTASQGGVNELNYETYHIKSAERNGIESGVSSIEKKKRLILDLDAIDQQHNRKSVPSNRSSHNHHYYSFEKSKSQNEVPSLGEADFGEVNLNKQDKVKLMKTSDNGKSKFIKGYRSANRIQKENTQELEKQPDKERNVNREERGYQEVSIETCN